MVSFPQRPRRAGRSVALIALAWVGCPIGLTPLAARALPGTERGAPEAASPAGQAAPAAGASTTLPAGAANPSAAPGSAAEPVTGPLPIPLQSSSPAGVPPLNAPAAAGTAAATESPPPPLSDEEFQALLASDDLDALALLCGRMVEENAIDRLALLRERLLTLHPTPQPLEVVLANADVLLRCQAPMAAQKVLDRYGPAPGPARDQWLLLQWRVADAALDHHRASLALERLVGSGALSRLDGLDLTLQTREDGTVVARPALELLADHLESRRLTSEAATLLLDSPRPGVAGAERLREVVRLLDDRPAPEREALLDAALDLAAGEAAWGLAAQLLDLQIDLASSRALERRLRLSPRIDDLYGEWRWGREDPAAAARTRELEVELRSPRSPGGHAAGRPAAGLEAGSPPSVEPTAPAAEPDALPTFPPSAP